MSCAIMSCAKIYNCAIILMKMSVNSIIANMFMLVVTVGTATQNLCAQDKPAL